MFFFSRLVIFKARVYLLGGGDKLGHVIFSKFFGQWENDMCQKGISLCNNSLATADLEST